MFIITMINIEIRIEFCMSALLNTTGIKKATATKEKNGNINNIKNS